MKLIIIGQKYNNKHKKKLSKKISNNQNNTKKAIHNKLSKISKHKNLNKQKNKLF